MARSLISRYFSFRTLFKKQGGWVAFKGGGRRQIILTIAADTASLYNIKTSAGNPTDVVDVILTINAGVFVKFGIDTGSGWATGSIIKIINKGEVLGTGGGGGAGATVFSSNIGSASPGQDGGHALNMQYSVKIDNVSGFFRGGGGGGGGGGAQSNQNPPLDGYQSGGGGGGGGRGYNNAGGGSGGNTVTAPGGVGTAGNNGSNITAGSGSNGGTDGLFRQAGSGGNGSDFGGAGASGGNPAAGNFQSTGAPGGAAGYAVKQNGFTLTWISGSGNVGGPVG